MTVLLQTLDQHCSCQDHVQLQFAVKETRGGDSMKRCSSAPFCLLVFRLTLQLSMVVMHNSIDDL